MATLTAYIFGKKLDIGPFLWQLQESVTSSQNVINFGPQTASNSTCIFTQSIKLTLRKFCILLDYQALQMEISKRNSTKLYQVVGSKSP